MASSVLPRTAEHFGEVGTGVGLTAQVLRLVGDRHGFTGELLGRCVLTASGEHPGARLSPQHLVAAASLAELGRRALLCASVEVVECVGGLGDCRGG